MGGEGDTPFPMLMTLVVSPRGVGGAKLSASLVREQIAVLAPAVPLGAGGSRARWQIVGGRRSGAGSARLEGTDAAREAGERLRPGAGLRAAQCRPLLPAPRWMGGSLSHRTPFSAEPRALGLKALGQRRHGPLTPRSQGPTNTGLRKFPLASDGYRTCICNLTLHRSLEAAMGDRKKCRGKAKVLGRSIPTHLFSTPYPLHLPITQEERLNLISRTAHPPIP